MLNCPAETGRDATFIIHIAEDLSVPLENGWIVVSTPSSSCVGQAAWHTALRTVTIHGDDPVTSAVDGALPGEALTFHFYDETGLRSDLTVLPVLGDDPCATCQADFAYQHDALYVATQIEIRTSTGTDAPAGIVAPSVQALYPNPARESAIVEIGLPATETVRITLFDVMGREVRRIHNDVLTAGVSRTHVETTGLASGPYLLRVEAESFTSVRSLVVVR